MIKLFKHLEKQGTTWFLLIAGVIFFLLRLPSFFEPYWYGDEGIYEVIGFALNKGRHLYTGIWDNKPPLLYIVYGIFNGIQPLVRIFSFVVGLASVFVFYYLAKKLFEKHTAKNLTVYITTSIYAFLLATPLLEGNIANAENFMVLPILLAGLLVLRFEDREHAKKDARALLIPGILLGIAFLFKVVAVFDFAAFFIFLFIINFKSLRTIKNQLRTLVIFAIGFFAPLFLTLAYFFIKGDGFTFIQSAFLSNVGYVGYANSFIIPQGLLVLKLIILGIIVLALFIKRHSISKTNIFISLWLSFSVFNALFSQRPYTHYALVVITSASLSVGLIMLLKKHKAIIGGSIGIIALIIFAYFSLFARFSGSFFGYYGNYISFSMGKKSALDYIGFFDKAAARDYVVDNFLKTVLAPNDNIFIWGNDGQLYRLLDRLPPGRFIVAYHITATQKTLVETSADLGRIAPRYVVIMPGAGLIPLPIAKYRPRFTIDGVSIYEKVF